MGHYLFPDDQHSLKCVPQAIMQLSLKIKIRIFYFKLNGENGISPDSPSLLSCYPGTIFLYYRKIICYAIFWPNQTITARKPMHTTEWPIRPIRDIFSRSNAPRVFVPALNSEIFNILFWFCHSVHMPQRIILKQQ